jgi:hypothetical protein
VPDIFNRNTDSFGGAFAADQGTITFPSIVSAGQNIGADVGLLTQRMAFSYQQQVTRLYEVGRSAVYYVGGRTSGDAGLDRVVGPRTIASAFYTTYGDMCRAAQNTLDFAVGNGCGFDGVGGTGVRGSVSFRCHFAVITAIAVNVAAADMLINESVRMMFSSLLYTSSSS